MLLLYASVLKFYNLVDLLWSIASFPGVLPQILPPFVPYSAVLAAFGAFVVWNGGIVLGTWQV